VASVSKKQKRFQKKEKRRMLDFGQKQEVLNSLKPESEAFDIVTLLHSPIRRFGKSWLG
jgi:hypothetical protein